MAESRFGANTSRKDRSHLSGFSTRRTNGGDGRSKTIRKTMNTAHCCPAALFDSIGTATQRDDGRIFACPIHRHAVAKRGRVLACVTNVVQLLVPTLDIRTVRSLFAP